MVSNAILAHLEQLEGLRIVASSGVRWIDPRETDWRIAQRLNADYIVTGELIKDSERASARVRLTEARRGLILVEREFDFPWADLERVEQEIGRAVAVGLSSALGED
jgi:TolB-like protein